jgi:hypothetical protein
MVIKEQKEATAHAGDEGDTILAYQALGGSRGVKRLGF